MNRAASQDAKSNICRFRIFRQSSTLETQMGSIPSPNSRVGADISCAYSRDVSSANDTAIEDSSLCGQRSERHEPRGKPDSTLGMIVGGGQEELCPAIILSFLWGEN